jgi:hypothetical protein
MMKAIFAVGTLTFVPAYVGSGTGADLSHLSEGHAPHVSLAKLSGLPSGKWCRHSAGKVVKVKAATQVQEWCDPKNNNRLQVDIFEKLANGNAGDYTISYERRRCRDAPRKVRKALC